MNIIKRIKSWNRWRKRCSNAPFYKLMVLIGKAHSPTFGMFLIWDEYDQPNRKGGDVNE